MSDDKIASTYPEFWAAYLNRTSDFRFPGGETGAEAASRVRRFVDERIEVGRPFVAFTHDGLIRTLLCSLLGIPVERRNLFRADSAGVLELEIDPAEGAIAVVRYNHIVAGNESILEA